MVQPTVAQISFYFGPDFISFAHTVPASRLSRRASIRGASSHSLAPRRLISSTVPRSVCCSYFFSLVARYQLAGANRSLSPFGCVLVTTLRSSPAGRRHATTTSASPTTTTHNNNQDASTSWDGACLSARATAPGSSRSRSRNTTSKTGLRWAQEERDDNTAADADFDTTRRLRYHTARARSVARAHPWPARATGAP